MTLFVFVVAVSASASQTHTERIRFEGLRCGQDRMQAFVRALAAAQELGYETRDVDADEGTFKGRLKQPNHHLRLVVKVTCSGARSGGHDAFKAFFGPPRVEVEAIFTARTGGRAAARTEGNRFRAKLDVLMDAYLPVPSCLGFTIGEVRSLDRETRARLKVDTGMVVQKVAAGGPATAAGLQPWDVLLGVDGVETPTFARLRGLLRRKKPGDTVTLLVSRAGRTVQPEVVLGRRGDDGSCAAVGAAASDRLPAPPQPVRDHLELGDVVVKPQPVSPGEPFDVELTVDLVSAAAGDEPAGVVLMVEILRDGRTLFSSSPEKVACRSGAVTTVVKHLRAGREPGDYELRVSVESGSLRSTRTVGLAIR